MISSTQDGFDKLGYDNKLFVPPFVPRRFIYSKFKLGADGSITLLCPDFPPFLLIFVSGVFSNYDDLIFYYASSSYNKGK